MTESKITLLSQDTIDQIAAGEVVERPASVVKELVENAIDAGATAISIEIRDGGLSLIRITDNGIGIRAKEIPLAFLRHSTSKIRSAADLHDLHSLGFRGEALSSIAAVALVELITKPADQLTAIRYCVEGGREVSFEEIGAPDGTTMIVRQLFYNTPARKKFLKSPATEGSYIVELVERLALSHPNVSFRLTAGGQERIVTPGNGSLKDCIYQLYGKEIASGILPISYQDDSVVLDGFIGRPNIARGNRGFETFFVQDRYVKSNVLSKAAEEGYHGFLMQRQYPFIVCHLHFDAALIDANVHPTKQEVRFENAPEIFRILSKVVSERLAMREDIVTVDVTGTDSPQKQKNAPLPASKAPVRSAAQRGPEPFETGRLLRMKEEITKQIREDTPYEAKYPKMPQNTNECEHVGQMTFLSEDAKRYHRLIGQVFDTYWLVEFDKKLYIIDQHAAHEKVLYERTMASLKEKEMTSQMISPPVVVSLGWAEQQTYEACRERFERLGFSVASFGGREFAIQAVPGNLFDLDPKALFLNILEECAGMKADASNQLMMEKIASMSCKAAVKGHDRLSDAEAEALIDELLSLDNPYHCPHGRPTIIAMSQYELEKKFKRIVS